MHKRYVLTSNSLSLLKKINVYQKYSTDNYDSISKVRIKVCLHKSVKFVAVLCMYWPVYVTYVCAWVLLDPLGCTVVLSMFVSSK